MRRQTSASALHALRLDTPREENVGPVSRMTLRDNRACRGENKLQDLKTSERRCKGGADLGHATRPATASDRWYQIC
jgi:hypothetical protein